MVNSIFYQNILSKLLSIDDDDSFVDDIEIIVFYTKFNIDAKQPN